MNGWAPWMANIGPDEPDYHDAIVELESISTQMANVATYDDWFPDPRPLVAPQQDGGEEG